MLLLRSALVACLLLGAITAHADPATNAAAKKLYRSGTNHYELSEFDAALADFREAYRIKDDPVFLFNIAQCYRQLKQEEQALQFYRTYLRRVPDARNRTDVEGLIATLEQAIAARPAPAPEPAPAPAPAPAAVLVPAPVAVIAAPPPKQPLYKKWWLWTAIGGVVVVGLGVGLGVGLTRSNGPTTYSPVQF